MGLSQLKMFFFSFCILLFLLYPISGVHNVGFLFLLHTNFSSQSIHFTIKKLFSRNSLGAPMASVKQRNIAITSDFFPSGRWEPNSEIKGCSGIGNQQCGLSFKAEHNFF